MQDSECPCHGQCDICRLCKCACKRVKHVPEVRGITFQISVPKLFIVLQVSRHDTDSEDLEVEVLAVSLNELMKHRKVVFKVFQRPCGLLVGRYGVPSRHDNANSRSK